MLNPLIQFKLVFIPTVFLLTIWDFRFRILDLWNRYALSIFNIQNSFFLKEF